MTTITRRLAHARGARAARLGKGLDKGKAQIASQGLNPAPQALNPATRAPSALHVESSAPRLLTVTQAAEALAVSHWTVRDWVNKGLMPSIRLPGDGRLVRILASDLAHFIDAGRGR